MTTFPFNRRRPIILDPSLREPFMPTPLDQQIRFPLPRPLRAMPTQPVGDPVPNPSTPQPTPQRDPSEPLQAPTPREPELPAIEPHQPGLPDTRIEDIEERYEETCVGDPPQGSRVQCWMA